MRKDMDAVVMVYAYARVCVARVESKSFVFHKSADSSGDVRTNSSRLQLA